MNSYYVQQADQISPIYGVSCLEEAKSFVAADQHHRIVETEDDVYMQINTGSVDFAGNWDDFDQAVEAGDLVKVVFDADQECWVE